MDANNMIMTKSKNNATRARTIKFVTRSSKKFAGKKPSAPGTNPNHFAGSKSRPDKEHQSAPARGGATVYGI